jgi:serine O-acetyltransferase
MNFLVILAVYILAIFVFFKDEILAIKDRDPAAKNSLEIILLYSGLHAIVFYRIAHKLWDWKLPLLPRALSQFAKFLTGIEIHPGATIGKGLFIDHGMGVVIGETSIIGNNVTMFQGSTLGGTGKETGKRHPTVGDNVVIGAGAKILGNITVGNNSYVGANAVVIKNVPHNATVVGVPAHIAKQGGKKLDELLEHGHVSDPVMQHMTKLLKRIKVVEEKLGDRDQGAEI